MTRLCLAAALAGLATAWAEAAAQATGSHADSAAPPGPAAPGLTLDSVVRHTLAASPRIQADVQEVERWRGVLLQSAGAFDAAVRTAVGSERDNSVAPATTSGAVPGVSSLATDRVSYSMAYERMLRSGIVVAPEVVVRRTSAAAAALGAPTGTASAGLRLTVPLLNNRGGRISRAAVRVAELDIAGNEHDVRFTASSAVHDAVVAYWDYRAAEARAEVQRAAEQRARRLVDETRFLVRADERPAADTLQLQANLATKRAARINAELGVIGVREQLGLAMGLPGRLVPTLPHAVTEFPAPAGFAPLTVELAGELTARALGRRADLLGAADKRHASHVELDAAVEALRPNLDVSFGVGYVGLSQGWGVGRFFAPLGENVPGLNSSVQLSYRLPTVNSGARGRAAQLAAVLEQQRIGERDIRRRVESGVVVAAEGVRRTRLALEQSATAVTLSQRAVDNERRRFQLGTSTLFDIIAAEDGLVNSLLGEINARRGHAASVVALRHATGTLVGATPEGRLAVPAGAAVTPP